MPRSQFAFNIARGGCWSRKTKRYLRASGLDKPVFVTDEARQRHVHPRHKRGQTGEAPGPSTLAAVHSSSASASGRGQPVNPFAQLRKKPDAPTS
jgi:hypothetical protein